MSFVNDSRRTAGLSGVSGWFLEQCGVGLGSIALGQLLQQEGYAALDGSSRGVDPLTVKSPHFAPKAKRVLYLFMAGGPSHMDLLDNKPQLTKFDGTLPPAELLKGYRAAFINPNSNCRAPSSSSRGMASPAPSFRVLPHLAQVIDDIAIVKEDRQRTRSIMARPDPHEHRLE